MRKPTISQAVQAYVDAAVEMLGTTPGQLEEGSVSLSAKEQKDIRDAQMAKIRALKACWVALQLTATLVTLAVIALAVGALVWAVLWLF